MIACAPGWREMGLRAATRHTRIVMASRWLLWGLIGIVVAVIIWVASGNGGQDAPRLVFSSVSKNESLENVMEQPRYFGTDAQNQPFTVVADKATQKDKNTVLLHNVKADLNQQDGTWVALNSGEGELDMEKHRMTLKDGVSLFYDGGYEFHTDAANVDMKAGSAYGDAPVEGQGPSGTLKADSFSASERGKVLRFNGSVRMTLYP